MKKAAKKAPKAQRVILVVDRGWIFAGDLSAIAGKYFRLDRAVHVFGWREIGFARVVSEWRDEKVDIRPMSEPVEVPEDAVVFRVPVAADWGLR